MPALEHYFRSDVKLVAGAPTQTAAKWTIARGMQPIVWLISNDVLAVANHPDYAQYDVVGAIKAGIENWNAAFGFPVLEARLASAGDSPGDDDKNFLMVDSDAQVAPSRTGAPTRIPERFAAPASGALG